MLGAVKNLSDSVENNISDWKGEFRELFKDVSKWVRKRQLMRKKTITLGKKASSPE